MLQRMLLSYSSGLVAAVSPCVLVLIPLCLARFVRPEEERQPSRFDLQEHGQASDMLADGDAPSSAAAPSSSLPLSLQLLQFACGFQLSFLLFGFALSSVLTSRIQDGFKLALGALFLTAAVLAAQGRVDPLRLPLARSAWWTGVSFALLLSFNPCTVPFLAALLSTGDPAHTLLSLLAFGNGLVTPAVLVVLVGTRLMTCLEASAFKMERIKPLTYALLAGSGLYLLMSPVYTMTAGDLSVGLVGIALALAMVHSAAGKPARQGAARACRIGPDGQLTCQVGRNRSSSSGSSDGRNESTRRVMTILTAVFISLLLIVGALLYDHEIFTHAAVDNMLAEAQQAKQHPQVLSLQAYNLSAVALDGGDDGNIVASHVPAGKLQQLRRQLIASPSTDASESASSLERDHLDQDALEVPHVMSDDEARVAAAASPLHPLHGLQLSAADLAALEAVAAAAATADPAEIDRTCVDLSMLPSCFQCALIVWLYRAAATLVALYALAHDRILALFAPSPSSSPRLLVSTPTPFTRLLHPYTPKMQLTVASPRVSPSTPIANAQFPSHSPHASPCSHRSVAPATISL